MNPSHESPSLGPNPMRAWYQGALRVKARHHLSGTEIFTDAPPDNNGQGQSFSPTDLLCVAYATCMTTLMGIKAQSWGIDLGDVAIELVKHMGTAPRRVVKIQVDFHFPSEPALSAEQKQTLEHAARTCPVEYSLHEGIEREVRFFYA